MKSPVLIILSLSFFLGCSNEPLPPTHEIKLFEGTFYTDERKHSDTLVFLSKKPKSILRAWSTMVWKISGDSIKRQDSRGLLDFLGKANCKYSLKGDLLTLKYQSKDGSGIDKYKVLTSKKGKIELIEIKESTRQAMDDQIRTDIQLR
jgi:hypothetical protein